MANSKSSKSSQPSCPITPIFELFSSKWKIEILWHLKDKPKRFNELKRHIPGISQKMLTEKLRQLERDGLVNRQHYPEIPPRVEYVCTDIAKALRPTFQSIHDWGETYKEKVL